MTKQKNKLEVESGGEFNTPPLLKVFLLITFVILMVLFFVNWKVNSNYKIYQEQCHNESQITGYEDFNFVSIPSYYTQFDAYYYSRDGSKNYVCNYLYRQTINQTDKRQLVDCEGTVLNLTMKEYRDAPEITKLYDGSTVTTEGQVHQQLETTYLIKAKREILKDVQVCDKVEVEEIKVTSFLQVEFPCNFSYYDKCISQGQSYESVYSCAKNQCNLTLGYNTKSKKDLTKDWLNNNCECQNICFKPSFYGKVFNQEKEQCLGKINDFPTTLYREGYSCSEYKCGDYSVEVQ